MILQIASTKGGVGKTTIALNLLPLFDDVIGLDADGNTSLSFWNEIRIRNSINPKINIVQQTGSEIRHTIEDFAKRYKNIIIDNAGGDANSLRATMVVADIVIFPLKPSQVDIFSVQKLKNLYEFAGTFNKNLRGYFLITQKIGNAKVKTAEKTIKAINKCGTKMDFLKTSIGSRQAYINPIEYGKTVMEMKRKDKKACAEIDSLYNEILEIYNART